MSLVALTSRISNLLSSFPLSPLQLPDSVKARDELVDRVRAASLPH